ncbi:MAG TPA: glycosyltransferase family 9 protein [Terriglobia bacterium]|nr:glycosyltransferase family 9 protein [Terriglobia bacterium]
MRRVLVIRLSSIGDIVHALPAVAALGESFPQLEIDWLIEKRYASLLAGNPYVRRILPLDTLSWRGGLPPLAVVKEMAATLRGLRESAYETAVDFQGLWKSALIACLANAQQIVGLDEPWTREPGAAVLYTQRVAATGRKHVVEESLVLAEHLGARVGRWQFPLPRTDADDRYVDDQLTSLGARDFIIVNPGGGWKAKRWAPQNYARLLQDLEGRLASKFLLTGSPDEAGSIAEIIRGAEARRAFYFPSSVVQFIALARRARLFLGGDTGPLHLAAAVGTPLVAIHGPTDPARNGPFRAADIALYNHAPVNHTRRNPKAGYIEGIPVERVAAAIEARLARANA